MSRQHFSYILVLLTLDLSFEIDTAFLFNCESNASNSTPCRFPPFSLSLVYAPGPHQIGPRPGNRLESKQNTLSESKITRDRTRFSLDQVNPSDPFLTLFLFSIRIILANHSKYERNYFKLIITLNQIAPITKFSI